MIPVTRPRLPRLDALAPYIRQIDETRWYSNFGPLNAAFEARLAARWGLEAGCVTTVSNATVGLELALRAAGARPGTLCLVPSWTFPASVHAAVSAGMTPCFVDVDDEGSLTPDLVRHALRQTPGAVGAVMPVSVYGQPLDAAAWDALAQEIGAAVVLDMAPGFDGATPGRGLSVVSLHATKVLGVGEGGFVVSREAAPVLQVRQRANFGFQGSREARLSATNAKLSEYAAAVGLAALDEWPQRRDAFQAAARGYADRLAGVPGVRLPTGWGRTWLSATCIVKLPCPAQPIAEALLAAGVETRAWWGRGMHRQEAFADSPRLTLATTERLADTTLGLPFSIDITAGEIATVCDALAQAVAA